MHDLQMLDATAQAQLLRRREMTAVELVEAAIEGVERLNPEINAVVTPVYERALDQARGELPEGPRSGVPCFASRRSWRRPGRGPAGDLC